MKFLPVLLLILLLPLIGCTTVTPQKASYVTLKAAGVAVDEAMKSVAAARQAGKVSDANWQKVRETKAKFNASYNAACDAASFDTTKPVSENLLLVEQDLLNLIILLTTP